MRKRLNTYASRMRAPREEGEEGDEGVQEDGNEDAEEVREESGEEEEEVQVERDDTEGDESGRMRGGSEMKGFFNYLNDDLFEN